MLKKTVWLLLGTVVVTSCSVDDEPFEAGPGGMGGIGTGGTGGTGGSGGGNASGGNAGVAGTGAAGGTSPSGGTGGMGGSGGTIAPAACGDGQLDIADGEQCDDGGKDLGDGCDDHCQFEVVGASCADGVHDPSEACDDGNLLNGDGCNPTCNFKNTTTLFAGSVGQVGYVDDIGPAALFGGESLLAVDDAYLYVGDGGNRRIRRVEIATAKVTTLAGDGTVGYLDDANGLLARFGSVDSIATDGFTLWIADSANHRVRAMNVTAPHAVTTLAGSGNQAVTDGRGTSAEFDGIRGLTYYAGYLYMVDGTAAILRRIDPVSGDVVTLAGFAYSTGNVDGVGGAARFISPRYIASDNKGTLYVADTNGMQIRTFDVATNSVGTFAGNGTSGYADGVGTAALVHRPRGITCDGTSVYWSEFNQNTIRQGVIATETRMAAQTVTTMLGQDCGGTTPCAGGYLEGEGTNALLNGPFSIVYHFASRSLFFFDGGNTVIRRVQ